MHIFITLDRVSSSHISAWRISADDASNTITVLDPKAQGVDNFHDELMQNLRNPTKKFTNAAHG